MAEAPAFPEENAAALLGSGFVYLPDAGGSAACGPRALAEEALIAQVLGAEATLGLDVQLAAVLTTDVIGCDSLYYVPVENDVLGLGYANSGGTEVFDRSRDTALQGIAFLNDMPYWDSYPEEFRTAFLHEVGHRWGARIGATRGGRELPLTGREGGHWSYFLDSAGSPLEGNRFDPSEALMTATPEVRTAYSLLDLYLMGGIPASEVGAVRLLDGGDAPGVDCKGHPVTAASPPQICEAKQLSGAWLDFTIDDVVNSEGPRVPSAEAAPRHFTFAAFVFGSSGAPWSEADCLHTRATLEERVAEFTAATGGRLYLDNVATDGLSCERLVAATTAPRTDVAAAHCSAALVRPRGSLEHTFALAILLITGAARRRLGTARRGRVPFGRD